MNRRVLIIACAFPPTGGPGVQRVTKFCKHLPRLGWLPTVWAHRALAGFPRDETLLDDVPPDVEVIRTGAEGVAIERVADTAPSRHKSDRPGVVRRWSRRVAAWVKGPDWPDACAAWARDGVARLVRLAEERGFDAMISTFSPPSNHWLAWEVKRITGLPWIADFRDLWTDDYRYHAASRRHAVADERFQQTVLENADAVIGVTPRQTDILRARAPRRAEDFHTVTNGFDQEDFELASLLTLDALKARRTESTFTLAHIGRLDQYRSSRALFEGLANFTRATPASRDRFMFRAVGHLGRDARTELARRDIPHQRIDYLDHVAAVREMMSATALLLTTPEGPNADSVIPAKLFEYLAARRPILVVGPPGECQRVVNECGAGAFAGLSAESIARQLGEWFDVWRSGRGLRGARTVSIQKYSRAEQTRALAGILQRVAHHGSEASDIGGLGKAAVA